MKTFYHTIFGPCAFRKNNYGVTVFNPVFHQAEVSFNLFCRKIICHTDDFTKQWRIPYPVIGKHDQFGMQHYQRQNIKR